MRKSWNAPSRGLLRLFARRFCSYKWSPPQIPSGIQRCAVSLPSRGILSVEGPDAFKFLQGMTTNDMRELESPSQNVIYSSCLTVAGRLIADVFIINIAPEIYYLDGDKEQLQAIHQHFTRYKLRSKIAFTPQPHLSVMSILHSDSFKFEEDHISFCDPRSSILGTRIILPDADQQKKIANHMEVPIYDEDVYTIHNILCGFNHGEPDRTPLECNLDHFNGVSFTKGCYVGQELTSRTHYTGTIRRRILPCVASESIEGAENARVLIQKISDTIKKRMDGISGQPLFSDEALQILPQIAPASFCRDAELALGESSSTPQRRSTKRRVGKVVKTAGPFGFLHVRVEHVEKILKVKDSDSGACYISVMAPHWLPLRTRSQIA
eukprot:TRINITY_DN3083_c0_g1_i1.p1 TRINITY_DN3083_c0_g1~~TRINITY_DN3083_c0_g1_i1.p1  ORF type:complete len:380 (+),score=18.46 TRINITY_DN3083_c0_g1_i1:18-1157(+)